MNKPWEDEPNELDFMVEGFPCAIRRHRSLLYLSGYIGVSPYIAPSNYNDFWPDVHGGWTFSSDRKPNGNPDGLVWFGFDCADCDDIVPGGRFIHEWQTYRTIQYVREELERVAKELAEEIV